MKAIECITSPDNQGVNAELTGNMPASAAGYDYPALAKIYPQPLLDLFQESLDAAAPRTVTPYWSDISGALQSSWHPTGQRRRPDPAGLAAVHRGRAARKEPPVSTVSTHHGGEGERDARSAEEDVTDRARAENRLGQRLVAPAVIVMLAVTAWPMIQALYLSLFRYRLTSPGRQGVHRPRATTGRCSPTRCSGRTP